jgi:hypothetical protein
VEGRVVARRAGEDPAHRVADDVHLLVRGRTRVAERRLGRLHGRTALRRQRRGRRGGTEVLAPGARIQGDHAAEVRDEATTAVRGAVLLDAHLRGAGDGIGDPRGEVGEAGRRRSQGVGVHAHGRGGVAQEADAPEQGQEAGGRRPHRLIAGGGVRRGTRGHGGDVRDGVADGRRDHQPVRTVRPERDHADEAHEPQDVRGQPHGVVEEAAGSRCGGTPSSVPGRGSHAAVDVALPVRVLGGGATQVDGEGPRVVRG